MKKNVAKRKFYKSPEIEKIPLLIEEQNATTCKTGGASGPGLNNCNPGRDGCFKQQPS